MIRGKKRRGDPRNIVREQLGEISARHDRGVAHTCAGRRIAIAILDVDVVCPFLWIGIFDLAIRRLGRISLPITIPEGITKTCEDAVEAGAAWALVSLLLWIVWVSERVLTVLAGISLALP